MASKKTMRTLSYASMKTLFSVILALSLLMGCKSRHTADKAGFGNGDQVLRISSSDDPDTLDPRKARDLNTVTYLHMLYEGLMRLDFHGRPQNALAQEVVISPDLKTYTFKLRSSHWSNGDVLTAEDFVRTWKSLLDPQFPAPNAYQFYMIKGARAAKEGKGSLDNVGISAPQPDTLVVELIEPVPYFTELLAAHFYYPVHPKFDPDQFVGNGPFTLFAQQHHYELKAKKNLFYWDAKEIRLDGIIVQILDGHTALRLFENGEIDWVGSPIGLLPPDALPSIQAQHQLRSAPGAGTHWFRANTLKAPFNNAKMRRAFALVA